MTSDLYREKSVNQVERQSDTADNVEEKNFRKGLHEHFKTYCSVTGIHGVSYFGERRMWYEYVWWIIVLTLSVSAAVYMIYSMYLKWLQSPVLVSFATKNTPIYNIPFPAVTICPIAQMDKMYFNLTKWSLHEYNSTEDAEEEEWRTNMLNYMDLVCPDFEAPNQTEYIDPDDFFNTLLNHHHWRSSLFFGLVEFNGETLLFESVFKKTFTQRGLCYTFNRFSLNDIYSDIVVRHETDSEDFVSTWDGDSGYRPGKSYPRRPSFAGMKNGLTIKLIDMVENNEMMCHKVWLGYTVTLHYPGRMPSTMQDFLFVPTDDFTVIPIHPAMVLTSPTIKNYEPDKRDCYFPTEKKLKYFNTYTGKNCEMECFTNVTLKTCDCVEFYMPRENGTKICGPGKSLCLEQVAKKMRDAQERKSLSGEYSENKNDEDFDLDECNCLAMCSDITYKAYVEPISVKEEQMHRVKALATKQSHLEFERLQFSTVVLYFKDDKIVATERNELYGPNDFISNFGGLLGLFTGFSILSLMEIIYFVTLRILGNIRLNGFWAG